MTHQTIIKFKETDIVPIKLDGELCVPIKSLCDAFGIEYNTEVKKIKEDELISSSLKSIHVEGAPEGERWILCMPVKYIYGWLYSITPGIVSKSLRDAFKLFRRECFKALYGHFSTIRNEGTNSVPLIF